MATAHPTGGGTWHSVQFRCGNSGLLRGCRAFSGKSLPRTRQIFHRTDLSVWQCGIRFGLVCTAAPAGGRSTIRRISFGSRTERSNPASRSGARVADWRRRFSFPIANGFLEWNRGRSAAVAPSRFFCPRLSSAVRARRSYAVNFALERAGAVSVSVLQAETWPRCSASAGRRRAAFPGVFILSRGMGVPANRLSGMRRRESREASRLHRRRT